MKTCCTLALLLFTLTALAQTSGPSAQNQPEYYLDSIKVSSEYSRYIYPNDIQSIDVNRDLKYPHGAIFMQMKNHDDALKLINSKLLSLGQITSANIPGYKPGKQPIIYLLDDKMLTDTVNIRIPQIAVKHVSVVKAAETPYFKTALPNVILVMISSKPPVVYIR